MIFWPRSKPGTSGSATHFTAMHIHMNNSEQGLQINHFMPITRRRLCGNVSAHDQHSWMWRTSNNGSVSQRLVLELPKYQMLVIRETLQAAYNFKNRTHRHTKHQGFILLYFNAFCELTTRNGLIMTVHVCLFVHFRFQNTRWILMKFGMGPAQNFLRKFNFGPYR